MKNYSINQKQYNKKDFVNAVHALLADAITLRAADNYTDIYAYYSVRDKRDYILFNGYGSTACKLTKSDISIFFDGKFKNLTTL